MVGDWVGVVITTDHFGNLITNIAREELDPFGIRWSTPVATESSSIVPMAMSSPARCWRWSIRSACSRSRVLNTTKPNASASDAACRSRWPNTPEVRSA